MWKIYVVCSYCGKSMGWKKVDVEPEAGMNISHGMCKKCFDIEMAQTEPRQEGIQSNV